MARLGDTVAAIAGRRGSYMAADIAQGNGEAKHYVERSGKLAEHQLEASMEAHPLLAIDLAACAGLMFGAMWRR